MLELLYPKAEYPPKVPVREEAAAVVAIIQVALEEVDQVADVLIVPEVENYKF